MTNGCWPVSIRRMDSSAPLRLCASASIGATSIVLALLVPLSGLTAKERDRSPVDLVLGPNEVWLATVNQTSDSVSLVRASDGKVLNEVSVGHHPVGITLA